MKDAYKTKVWICPFSTHLRKWAPNPSQLNSHATPAFPRSVLELCTLPNPALDLEFCSLLCFYFCHKHKTLSVTKKISKL